jgi:hypothetical protein
MECTAPLPPFTVHVEPQQVSVIGVVSPRLPVPDVNDDILQYIRFLYPAPLSVKQRAKRIVLEVKKRVGDHITLATEMSTREWLAYALVCLLGLSSYYAWRRLHGAKGKSDDEIEAKAMSEVIETVETKR